MRKTSRKLKRLIEEEEKTVSRIEELQEYLKEIREARKKEEDLVIIRSIRSMRLGARDLFDLLSAIQDGNLSKEMREQLLEGPEEDKETSGQSAHDGDETEDLDMDSLEEAETADRIREPVTGLNNKEGVNMMPESEEIK